MHFSGPSKLLEAIAGAFLLVAVAFAQPDSTDASNFITVATGSQPSPSDPRIAVVQSQLQTIQRYCASRSRGASITDKMAKSHSLLQVKQPLLALLTDFVRVARAQCSAVDDSTLLSLYVLERNSGAQHGSTIDRLSKNPGALVAKWSSR